MRSALLGILLASAAGTASSELVIVVNPISGVERLSRDEATNIFMGRYRRLPSGVTALPVDQSESKAEFYRRLVDKDLADIRSYWARLVFSGQESPPQQLHSDQDIIEIVTNNKGAIGYIDSKRVDERVKVVLRFAP